MPEHPSCGPRRSLDEGTFYSTRFDCNRPELFQVGQAQAQTAIVGILTVTVTVILATAIPQGGFVGCEANVTSLDNAAGGIKSTVNQENEVVVGVVNGGTATCTLILPYYWNLVTSNVDIMIVSYGAAILPAGATVNQGRISAAPPYRDGNHSFPAITGVPVTGTHWTLHATTKL